MAIVADITALMLSMIGLESVTDGPDALQSEIIATLQRAQGTLADANPAYFYRVRQGFGLPVRAPVSITVAVTKYSEAVTVTGWQAWMAGCTCLIEGDTKYNRLLNVAAADSVRTLMRPYMGTTGTYSATVWADWLLLPENVRRVLMPVMLDQQITLRRSDALADLSLQSNYGIQPLVGLPTQWYPLAFTHLGKERGGIALNHLSGAEYLLTYNAEIAYTPITTLSDTRLEIIAQGRDLELFWPVVQYLFATQPGCSTPKQELAPGFEQAMLMARGLRVDGSRQKVFAYNPKR